MRDLHDLVGPTDELRRFVQWRPVVRYALGTLGGEANFNDLIRQIRSLVPARWLYRHWEAKVAFILRTDRDIDKVGRDRYRLRPARSRADES